MAEDRWLPEADPSARASALAARAERRALALVARVGPDLGVDDLLPLLAAVGDTVRELQGISSEEAAVYLDATLRTVLRETRWPICDWAVDRVILWLAPAFWRYLGVL